LTVAAHCLDVDFPLAIEQVERLGFEGRLILRNAG